MPVASAPVVSRYRYNPIVSRYIDARGRFVSAAAVRAELDRALVNAAQRAQLLAGQLRTRDISVDEWTLGMRQIVKEVHLYSGAAARGGWAQLSQADYGRIGRLVRDEYAWLEGFADDLLSGKQPLDGRFFARVTLYTEAGRQTFHAIERQDMLEGGMTQERSLLAPADHCSECLSEAARDWVAIGSLIPIGQRICGRRCKCRVEYR